MTSPASAHELAAAQIELAIREAQAPVEALGRAIGNLSARARDPDELDREISTCVESLQFIDRLTQHLTHVRDLLLDGKPDQEDHNPELWQQSCARIRARLVSQAQRDLFDLLVGQRAGGEIDLREPPAPADGAGSIELF